MRPETLQDYADFVRRQTFLLLLIAVLLGGTVIAVGLRAPRMYAAGVLMEFEETQASPVSNVVQTALGSSTDPVMLETMIGRLSARPLLDRVLEDFDAAHPIGARLLPPAPHLAKRVRALVETGSRLVRLGVELREAEGGARNAALLANHFADTFRAELAAEERDRQLDETETQLELVEAQKEKVELAIAALQEELLQFASTRGNQTLWAAELQQLLARRETLEAERRIDQLARQSMDAMDAAGQQALQHEPELQRSGQNEAVDPLHTNIAGQILAYEAKAAEYSGSGLAENAPELRGTEEAVKRLTQRLEGVPERLRTDAFSANQRRDWLLTRELEARLDKAGIENRLDRLDVLIDQADHEIRRRAEEIPQSEVELGILRDHAASLRAVYEDLLLSGAQMEIARGAADAQTSDKSRTVGGVAIVDPARPELRPVKPRVLVLIATGAALGLLTGFGVALVAEWRASTRPYANADPGA